MTFLEMLEQLKDKKFLDGDLICSFDIIFWSDLRSEWVIRYSDESKDGIVEFIGEFLEEAVEVVYSNEYEQEVIDS